MKTLTKNLKQGDKIKIADKICKIESTEISEIGKQGVRKCRIAAKTDEGESIVIIRPEDYPIEKI